MGFPRHRPFGFVIDGVLVMTIAVEQILAGFRQGRIGARIGVGQRPGKDWAYARMLAAIGRPAARRSLAASSGAGRGLPLKMTSTMASRSSMCRSRSAR